MLPSNSRDANRNAPAGIAAQQAGADIPLPPRPPLAKPVGRPPGKPRNAKFDAGPEIIAIMRISNILAKLPIDKLPFVADWLVRKLAE